MQHATAQDMTTRNVGMDNLDTLPLEEALARELQAFHDVGNHMNKALTCY